MKLIGYFRSSAAFRVRIGLNLKGLKVEHASRHLRRGEQSAPDYVALNPQKLVPAMVVVPPPGASKGMSLVAGPDPVPPGATRST